MNLFIVILLKILIFMYVLSLILILQTYILSSKFIFYYFKKYLKKPFNILIVS